MIRKWVLTGALALLPFVAAGGEPTVADNIKAVQSKDLRSALQLVANTCLEGKLAQCHMANYALVPLGLHFVSDESGERPVFSNQRAMRAYVSIWQAVYEKDYNGGHLMISSNRPNVIPTMAAQEAMLDPIKRDLLHEVLQAEVLAKGIQYNVPDNELKSARLEWARTLAIYFAVTGRPAEASAALTEIQKKIKPGSRDALIYNATLDAVIRFGRK